MKTNANNATSEVIPLVTSSAVGLRDILVRVPLIYCDHNFIVTAHQGPDVYKDHLRRLVASGAVTVVLSPTHWIEAAEDNDAARGIAKADLMDSLETRWLHNRRTIQRREVSHAFFRFARIPIEAPQMIGDVRAVIADLAGEPGHRDSRALSATSMPSEITILWNGTYTKRSKRTNRTKPGSALAR